MKLTNQLKSLLRSVVFLLAMGFSLTSTKAAVTDIVFEVKDPTCANQNDGYIIFKSFTTAGPTGPTYNFRFNFPSQPRINVSVGDTIFNLAAGNYFIDIIDNGVYYRDDTLLIPPTGISAFFLETDPSCFSFCDGSIDVFTFGGVAPYTYQWNDPGNQTTSTASGLCDGTYILTITDNNGCTAVDSATVTEPTQIQPNVVVTNTQCDGSADGSATATPSGGTGNYVDYDWSSSLNNTATENGLAAGTYTVTVTDDDGCTNEETFVVGSPPALGVNFNITNNLCFGENNGSIVTTPSGGTPPYTFSWDDGPTVQNRNNLIAGTYTLTITDDNNCQFIDSAIVTERPEIILNVTVNSNNLCFGDTDGSISVGITGGTAGYNYVWSEGTSGSGNNTTISNLAAGTYTITVTDAFGCDKIDSATITEPTEIIVSVDNQSDPTCNGGSDGSIDISASGGTVAVDYSYLWSAPGNPTTPSISGLSSGTYIVTVTDDNNCAKTESITLNDPQAILPNLVTTPVTCFGGSDGSATASPTGGDNNYTYTWSSSANTTNTESGLSAGTYTVSVEDGDGCLGTEIFVISQPATPIILNFNVTNNLCFGGTNGSIITTISGGDAPYTYSWRNGPSVPNRNNLSSGFYVLTVTDANNCVTVDSAFVDQRPDINISFNSTDVSCNGDATGSATASISGGTAGYNYVWSEGTSGAGNNTTISNLSAGTYTITVTDAFGCDKIDSIIITEPPAIQIVRDAINHPSCAGDNDGSINLSISGGTPALTFAWNTTDNTEDISGLSAGNYVLTITDGNNCIAIFDTTLVDPLPVNVVFDSIRNVSCNGQNDGFLRVAPTGGTGAYTYDWSNLANSSSIDNLSPGTYIVTITDNNGCFDVDSATITEPAPLNVNITSTDASCNGVNDGTARANTSGGTAPYTYIWAPNGETTEIINNLGVGTYTVTVTDANNCTTTDNVVIGQPNVLSVSINGNDLSCNNDSSGVALANVLGGTAPFTFDWSDPDNQTTNPATNLDAGPITVTVTDNNGCIATSTTTLNEPSVLTANINASNPPTCNGVSDGDATVTPGGGTAPYTFSWSTIPAQTTATASNLGSGTFIVTVTDNNNCSTTDSVTLIAPNAITISLDTLANVSCNGGNDGRIRITANGGTTPYTYSWSNGPGSRNNPNLSVGTYTISVQDANGCTNDRTFSISEPPALTLNLTPTDVVCSGDNDGTITTVVGGGTPNYTFDWSDLDNNQNRNNLTAGTYILTVTDANGCQIIDSATINAPNALNIAGSLTDPTCAGDSDGEIDITVSGGTGAYTYDWNAPLIDQEDQTNLSAGTYAVTVSDANGCSDSASFTLNDPAPIAITAIVNDISCNGFNDGSIDVSVSNGTPPYTFAWDDTTPTEDRNNLGPGTYLLTVTDNNLCTNDTVFVITEPSPLSTTVTATDEQCFGESDGSITANPSGGTPPYSYVWNPGGATTQTVNNLAPGFYTVQVTDANGCVVNGNGTIAPANPFFLTVVSTPVSCFGLSDGQAAAVALGGAPPYTYSWSGGTNPTLPINTNLTAGTYRITVTDDNGCELIDSTVVTEPDSITINLSTYDVNCGSTNDGAAAVNPSGGTPPYTYVWGPGNPVGQNTDSISSLTAGAYAVTVSDNNGCDNVANFNILQQSAPFFLNDSIFNVSCNGFSDGEIRLGVIGATPPLTFDWNPVTLPQSRVQTGLSGGTYDVTVTDDSGCSLSASYVVSEPAALTINGAVTDESCNPGNDGAINLTVSGGTSPYTYSWNPATLPASANQTNLTAGTYTVTVTDANNCSSSSTFNLIQQGNSFSLNFNIQDISCNGAADGQITVTPSPAGSYSFQWEAPLANVANPIVIAGGTYRVTVTDLIGNCSVLDSVTVNEPDTINPNFTLIPTGCSGVGGASGSVTANASGGNGSPYTYNWNTPGGTVAGNTVTDLAAGTYTVTISDNSTCSNVLNFTINTATSNIDPNETVVDASCNGDCDGSISLNPLNGVTPYFYNWSDDPTVTLPNRNNLCAGTYTVTITGSDNCDTVHVINVGEPAAITASLNITPDTCANGVGGARVLSVANGTGPYNYNWPASGTSVGDSVNSLTTGNYNLTITDATGCSNIQAFNITNDATFTIGLDSTDVLCNGQSNGTITVNVIGGTSPVTYDWSSASLSGANPSNVSAGTYTITVTDANGCGAIQSITVNQPAVLTISSINTTNESCVPGNDGTATAVVGGGTTPYSYTWPTIGVPSGNTVSGLPSGNYQLTVTDANGCTTIDQFSIGTAAPFTVNINSTDASCNGGTDGSISITVNGATPPLTYNWLDIGVAGPNRTNLAVGNYRLTITDDTGCSETTAVTISEDDAVQIDNITTTDESCVPGNDGAATSIVSGGTTPYIYDWSNGDDTPGIVNVTAGTYTLTVTDQNGCSAVASVNVQSGSNIEPNETINEVSCFMGSDGSISLSPSGGDAPYAYDWAPITSIAPTITSLSAGGYQVTITDNNGCSTIESFIVGQANDLRASFNTNVESCDPGNDGSVRIFASGGTGPYTYDWGSGNTNVDNQSNLVAGVYTMTLTDDNACTKIFTYTINPAPTITVSSVSTPATCGGNDGTITVSVINGSNPLTYDWSDITVGGADPIGLAAGTYTVTVTDGNGCTGTETINITTNGNYVYNELIVDASCNGASDGSITLAPTGGIAPYSYVWSNGPRIATNSNLAAGSYTVTVTDDSNCSNVETFVVGEPDLILSNLVVADESCSPGNDGSISAFPTGGTSPYTYDWLPITSSASSITSLTAGTYSLTITDDNGCVLTETINIGTGGNIIPNEVLSDVSCNGLSDGSITLAPSGGVAPYTYQWLDGPTSANRNNIAAGTYEVTIIDATNCSTIVSYTINEPSALDAGITSQNPSCFPGFDGEILTNANGGTPPYTYDWGPNGETTTSITNLIRGTYTLTLTDQNNCSIVETITLTRGSILANPTIINASCPGSCDGSINLNPTGGGLPNYSYDWDNGTNFSSRTNLCAGTYSVTISSGNCTTIETFTINEPAAIAANLIATDESCSPGNDGTALAAPTGGTPPYSYQWAPDGELTAGLSGKVAGTYTVTIIDDNGCSISDNITIGSGGNISLNETINDVSCNGACDGSISLAPSGGVAPYTYQWLSGPVISSIGPVCAGTYEVEVRDANNCITIQSFTINEPPLLSVTINTDDESCTPGNDGSVLAIPSGGTPPYTYSWDPGSQTTAGIINLSAGTYTVTVFDANNCSITDVAVINSGGNIILNEITTDVSCNGVCDGRINLSPSGGQNPYSFTWSDDPTLNLANRNGLCAGSYDVTVTDDNGCSAIRTIDIIEPSLISASFAITDASCTPGGDGEINSTVSGGTPPYTYDWLPGNFTTPDLTSLAAGTYTVTITDDNGCSIIESRTVNSGGNLTLIPVTSDALCNGSCDGTINLSPAGGVSPYSFDWSDDPTINSGNRIGLCAGSYTVTVTDDSGCSGISTIDILEPTQIQNSFTINDESCTPGGDGSALANPSGGTAPYTYAWAPNGQITRGISSQTAGSYTLTITDANNCSIVETASIGSVAPFSISTVTTDASCNGVADGIIDITVNGAVGALTYDWNDIGLAGPLRNNLLAGNYTVTITDGGNGCIDTENYTISEPSAINLSTVVTDASCAPGNDGTIDLTVSGGQSPYSYQWDLLPPIEDHSGLAPNVYTVTVTDDNNCTASISATVGGSAPFTVSVNTTDVLCNGGSDGSINISLSGETPPVNYSWAGPQFGSNPSGLTAGSYTVTISDNSGCSEVRSINITEPAAITANVGSISTSNCGVCDGKAYIDNANGGTGSISFDWLDASKTPISQTQDTARNLCQGVYFVALEDANNCVDTLSVTVSDGGSFPVTVTVTDESCENACDGSATVSSPCISNLDCTVEWRDVSNNVVGTNPTIANLCPGDYFAEITDINSGCIVNETVTIDPATPLITNLSTADDGCSALAVCQGYAKAEPSGGVAPYTFNWAGPSTNISGVDSIGGLCAGSYTLTLSDANGCDNVINFNIAPTSSILPNESFTNESCSGICDGTAEVNPSSGQAPYTYDWSNGAGDVASVSGLCAGAYTVTITDAVACDTAITFNIGTVGLSYTLASTNLSCNGGCDGTAEVQIPGGTSGYSFNWDPAPGSGQGTAQVGGLCAGQYDVTITLNSSGCSAVDNVNIGPATAILPNESSSSESCANACDGVARVSPSGGVGNYTFVWTPTPPNNQQGNSEIRDLCAGTYSVQIIDGAGCDTSVSFNINAATAIVSNIGGEDQLCGNANPCEGKAFVSPSGGQSPYTYQWTLGVNLVPSQDTALNLCNGKYFVTITDANACTSVDSITISSPAPIDTSFTVSNSTCNICDGSIQVFPTGGQTPYTYNWLDASQSPLGVTTDLIEDLCSGIYFVDITDAANCSERFARPLSDIGSESVTVSTTDVNCFNGNDGTATANFVCSDAPCTVAWFDGNAQNLNLSGTTVNNLSAGTYFVEVTNGSGCKAIESFTIGQPTEILVGSTISEVSCEASCDGSINLNVAGGSSPYSFIWSPSPGSGQGTPNVSGLCSRDYQVTIIDANGCDTTLNFNVGSPDPLAATFNVLDANCNQSDGFITATISGGTVTFDYQYQWFDAANNLISGANAPSIANVAAGTYFLRVRDDNGCEQRFTAVVGSTNGPSVTVDSVQNIGCFGGNDGAIFISATDASIPLTFNWLNQGQSSEDIQNLSAGTYTVQVRNALGCVTTASAQITEADQLNAVFANQDAVCGQCNGEASVSINGGSAPYTYLWSNGSTDDNTTGLCGGAHSLTVRDANGCSESFNFTINTVGGPSNAIVSATAESCAGAGDGSVTVSPVGGTPPYTYEWLHNGANTSSLSNLSAGKYFLLITDVAGCSRNVEVEITAPTDISIQETVVPSGCGPTNCSGSVALNVNGGIRPYAYEWNHAPGNDTNFFGGLCSGVYNVTVTDANGCSEILSLNVPNNDPFFADPSFIDVSCPGSCDGSLISNVNLSPNVSFQWLNSEGSAIAPADANLNNSVCAGDYVLEVTTQPGGCKTYASVSVNEPDSILLGSSIVKNISCNDACDGEIFISTIGGEILYSYSWDDPNNQDGIPASDLCAGVYSVTATDANGCTATTSVNLVNPAALFLNLNSSTVLDCSSDCDGEANVSASGGNAPYTFNWSGGQSGNNPTTLCFGPNTVTVTDATGCSEELIVNIAAVDTVVAQVPAQTLYCDGDSIQLNANIIGSTVSNFGWYLADTTTLFTNTADTAILRNVGTHTFFLIATNGSCNDTTEYTVEVVNNPSLTVPAAINIYKDEVANIQIEGEDQTYLYNWSPATDLNDSTLAEPTSTTQENITYVLTVTDTNGCNFLDSVQVIYNEDLGIPSGISPNGDGMNDVWRIDVLEEFPNATVQIFNRWGELLYEQANGYTKPWDGTYEGKALPVGTYYFVIDLKSDRFDPITGPITIIK